MADQDQHVSIVAWPAEAAQLEHHFNSAAPCPVSVTFEPAAANVALSTDPQQPLQIAMNMQLTAREPVPICITLCEPICARSDYSIGIQIFGNPFATIDVRGTTRLFACRDDEPPPQVCVDFREFQSGTEFSAPLTVGGLVFRPLGAALRAVDFGEPAGVVKLGFPPAGVRIEWPSAVGDVVVRVNNYANPAIEFAAFAGSVQLARFSVDISNELKTVSFAESGITAVEISGGNNEAGVVDICYRAERPA